MMRHNRIHLVIATLAIVTISFTFGTSTQSHADDISRMAAQATAARDAIAQQYATVAGLRDKFEAASTKLAEKKAAMDAAEAVLKQNSGLSGQGNNLKGQAEALLRAAKTQLGARNVAAAQADLEAKQVALYAVLGNPSDPDYSNKKTAATAALNAAKVELKNVREAEQAVKEAQAAVDTLKEEFSHGILSAAEAAANAQKARTAHTVAKTVAEKAQKALEKAEQKLETLLDDNALLLGSTTLFTRIGNRLQQQTAPAATSSSNDPGLQARVTDLVAQAEKRQCDANLQTLIEDLQRAANGGQHVDPAVLCAAESQVQFASFKN